MYYDRSFQNPFGRATRVTHGASPAAVHAALLWRQVSLCPCSQYSHDMPISLERGISLKLHVSRSASGSVDSAVLAVRWSVWDLPIRRYKIYEGRRVALCAATPPAVATAPSEGAGVERAHDGVPDEGDHVDERHPPLQRARAVGEELRARDSANAQVSPHTLRSATGGEGVNCWGGARTVRRVDGSELGTALDSARVVAAPGPESKT